MFGEYLQLERSVSTGFGDNSITLCDTITNLAPREDYLELLYHCNFGYPFASPDLEFEAPPHEVVPRDAEAAAGWPNGTGSTNRRRTTANSASSTSCLRAGSRY